MAEIFPDEGLDLILNIFPKGGTNLGIAGQYLGLWTAFTASTVGSSGQTRSSYTETTFTNYARVAMSSWGSPAAGTGGRKVVGNQVTFPTAGATPVFPANSSALAVRPAQASMTTRRSGRSSSPRTSTTRRQSRWATAT